LVDVFAFVIESDHASAIEAKETWFMQQVRAELDDAGRGERPARPREERGLN